MTLVEAESPSSDAGSGEWRDHWPHISYSINYDHENQKQVDPETVLALLQSEGLTEEDIDGLHISIRNPMKGGTFPLRYRLGGYFATEGFETKGPVICISYTDDTQQLGRRIVHEATHYYDSINDERYRGEDYGRRAAPILGLGAAAVLMGVSHQTGVFSETGDIGKIMFGAQATSFVSMPTFFRDVAYSMGREEKRAKQAEMNNPLVQEEIPDLLMD